MSDDCERCQAHIRRFEAVMIDLQNAQADVVAKNRQIGKLKAELTKTKEDSADAVTVKRVLEYWRKQCREGSSRVKIPLDGERADLTRKRLKHFEPERLMAAIDGAAAFPFVVNAQRRPFGQKSQRFDDLTLIFRNEVKVEEFEKLSKKDGAKMVYPFVFWKDTDLEPGRYWMTTEEIVQRLASVDCHLHEVLDALDIRVADIVRLQRERHELRRAA